MATQLPLIIAETSKAITAMMVLERFVTGDLKKIKQAQTDLALKNKAAVLNSPGNKSQFLAFASIKSFLDTSSTQIDDLQLKEEDTDSETYATLDLIKQNLSDAVEIIEKRLDLITKADGSKVGWSAAILYDKKVKTPKSNADAEKMWAKCEKAALEEKKTKQTSRWGDFKGNSMPFQTRPVSTGYSYSTSKGTLFTLYFLCLTHHMYKIVFSIDGKYIFP
jgi:hypothetical protein